MLAELDIAYFAQAYFPDEFDKPFCQFHFDLMKELKWLMDNEAEKMVVGVPRSYGKSQLCSFLLPLWILIYKKLPFILLVSATQDTAAPFLSDIKQAISSNQSLIEDFGKLKSDKKWSADQIELNNDTCLIVRGINGSLRGIRWRNFRPSICIVDDLVKDDIASSDSQREQLAKTYRGTLLKVGDEKTRFLTVGTIVHADDIMAELLSPEQTGYKQLFYKSVMSWAERTDLWAEWRKLYTDREDKDRKETAYQYYKDNEAEMLKGVHVLWPEKLSYYFLIKELIDEGEAAFYQERQNQPREAGTYVFKDIQFWDSLPDLKDCDVGMFVDSSMGKERGDYSAITIMAKHKVTGYKYILDGTIKRIKPDKLIDLIVNKLNQFDSVSVLAFESISMGEVLLDYLKKRLMDEGILHIRIKSVKPKVPKKVRIMWLQPDIANGVIKFNKDNSEYNTQVKDWNDSAKYDDAPDSLAGIWEIISKVKKKKKIQPKPSWLS